MPDDDSRLFRHPDLYVAPCNCGVGVFAARSMSPGTVLEECPFLTVVSDEDIGGIEDYVFSLENDDGETLERHYALVLGYGSLFNHANIHNTEYWHDRSREVIVFHTVKDVGRGDQLFIDYGAEYWDSRGRVPL